jgi:hypothetical protein
VPNDALERTYYTGEAQPRMTYTTIAPAGYRYLGTPAPTGAPTVVGEALPADAITGTGTAGGWDTDNLLADFVIEDNLPANLNSWYMSDNAPDGYEPNGTIRVYGTDFFIGKEMRVVTVPSANTVTLADAAGGPYLAAGTDNDRQTINKYRTDDAGTTRDGYFRFYVPNGTLVTLPLHSLQVGDVIRVTALPTAITIAIEQRAAIGGFYGAESDNGAGTAGSNTWPAAPVSIAADAFWIAGTRAYPLVNVWFSATGPAGTASFVFNGSFSWTLVERDGVDYADYASDIESRAYVYTYVSELGEEGPPSPASDVVTIPSAGDVTLSAFATAPSTQRNITHRRIYRANTGSDQTVYQYVVEITVATSTYLDQIADLDLGEVLQTESWDPPPTDMIGIIALPNGGMAGFINGGKTVCFAEPYYPHAWPPEYQIAVDHEVVGLGIVPNGVAVLTKGPVYIASGDHPRAMSTRHFNDSQACVSRASIANTTNGVLYSAPDGLAFVGSTGFRLVTEAYVTKREWQALFEPSGVTGFWHDNKYVAFHSAGGFVLHPDDESIGLSTHDQAFVAGYLDTEDDILYVTSPSVDDGVALRLVAVSSDGTNRVMYSDNALTWVSASAASALLWQYAAYGAGYFVAVASNGTANVMRSSDGITWAGVTPATAGEFSGIAYSPTLDMFAMGGLVGGVSGIETSTDAGLTWTSRTVAATGSMVAMLWVPWLNLFVAASSGNNPGCISTSPDGITWTQRTTTGISGVNALAHDGSGVVVAVGNNDDIVGYSSDAISWSVVDIGASNFLGVAFGAGLFVAVLPSGAAFRVHTSPTGASWTSRTAPAQTWNDVLYSSVLGLFVAVAATGSGNRVMTSPDGITWTNRTSAEDNTWTGVTLRTPTAVVGIWDGGATPLTLVWRSGRVRCAYPLNLGAARVHADAYPVTFRLYNDQGDLVTTRTITSDEVIRLPGGYLTSWFEVELEGAVAVNTVHVAETVRELLQG